MTSTDTNSIDHTAPDSKLVEFTARRLSLGTTGFSYDDLMEEQQAELCDRVKPVLDACHAEEMLVTIRSLVELCPQPQEVSMGFDSPPEFATQKDFQLAYALHETRALLAKLENVEPFKGR